MENIPTNRALRQHTPPSVQCYQAGIWKTCHQAQQNRHQLLKASVWHWSRNKSWFPVWSRSLRQQSLSRSQAHDYQFKLCERSISVDGHGRSQAEVVDLIRVNSFICSSQELSPIKAIIRPRLFVFSKNFFRPNAAKKNKMLREAFKEKVLQSDKSPQLYHKEYHYRNSSLRPVTRVMMKVNDE
ncbi:hypothetical protein GWK47_007980 [Chionoecetes opilio]|uniref:Uncharacterized protein n=1 Tax=Chionoecetes opilio TaxID=41210 RepID=A0A8J4Y6G7_CHIOP|nr:hypothetical protein GWK47_007980 [Chionoecetes opilio]